MSTGEKTGVILLNLGGPDNLKAVKPFLYNLFSDPDIFDVMSFPCPEFIQKPLAWLISTFRNGMAVDAYRRMGGRSPILPLTQDQANALKTQLASRGIDVPVYIGMRYWHPFVQDTVDLIIRDGIENLIVLPLYPQYSLTTTGSSIKELEKCLQERKYPGSLSVIHHYHDHPDYQAALAAMIQSGLAKNTWSCPVEEVLILFSAHSLPQKFVEKTQDIYPQHILETAQKLMTEHFPQNPWRLCYQSKIGKIPWLRPYTDEIIREFARTGTDNVLIIPISFVSDHIETLYEIDLLYLPLAQELNLNHCYRAESLNSNPLFIQALAGLVEEKLKVPQGVR